MSERSADVVVVGAGSAGAVVARRLVDGGAAASSCSRPAGATRTRRSTIPAALHELWLSEVDWAYETVPQAHADGRRLAWPRGRSSAGRAA